MKGNIRKILFFSSMFLLLMAGCSGKNGNNGTNGTNGINSSSIPFLTLMEYDPQQVLLSWTQVYGATGYTVYTSTTMGGPYVEAGTTTTGSTTTVKYLVDNLTPGTTYYFVVTAQFSSVESPYSNVVSYHAYALYTYPGNNGPTGMAIDAAGNVLTTNFGDNTVSELSPTGTPGIYQTITTYGVGSEPDGGIAIDQDGNVLITNFGDNTVSELSPTGTPGVYQTNTTYAVGNSPSGMAIDAAGNLWIANYGGNTVSELSPTGTPGIYQTITTYGVGSKPYAIAIDKDGNVFVANTGDNTVSELSPTGTLGIFQTATTFDIPGQMPWGIAIDKSGNILVVNYFVDPSGNNGSVTQLSPNGSGSYYTYTTYTAGIGYEPEGGIAVDSNGNVWITNSCADVNCVNGSITELSPLDATDYYYNATYALPGPGYGIAIDASGDLWLTDLSAEVTELYGLAAGPQFWPYAGPVFPGNGMW